MDTPEVAATPGKRRPHTRKRSERANAPRNAVEQTARARPAAASAENAIREGRRRLPAAEPAAGERGRQKRLALEPRAGRGAEQASDTASSVPPEVEKRFVRVGREFYFPGGTRAFTDRGRRLTTPSENTEVIRSLIKIARARGWQSLVVTGTERFRRDAWLAAHAAGIEARGYRPSEFEVERAVRAKARAEGREAQRADDSSKAEAPRAASVAGAESTPARRAQVRGWIKGRLIEHGPANYRHDPQEPPSYFVKLETERGERTVWGVDLERALKQALSRPKIGDPVAMRAVRREPVTVRAPALNGRGEVTGTQPVDKHRNRWIVEQQEFLKARAAAAATFADAKVEARDGARRHPELLGSYMQLRSAKALATERIRDRQDQATFVENVRRVLARSIARGEPLPPVRLREAPPKPSVTPRRPERDVAIVR
jgi:hypothetical protein